MYAGGRLVIEVLLPWPSSRSMPFPSRNVSPWVEVLGGMFEFKKECCFYSRGGGVEKPTDV